MYNVHEYKSLNIRKERLNNNNNINNNNRTNTIIELRPHVHAIGNNSLYRNEQYILFLSHATVYLLMDTNTS